ncbi:hypothetical protein [Nocardia amamiensis]|uniref:hypothetical protein n=1 Tax=Nocardia amamiensis TaxID=404578 RepID=UPI0034064699
MLPLVLSMATAPPQSTERAIWWRANPVQRSFGHGCDCAAPLRGLLSRLARVQTYSRAAVAELPSQLYGGDVAAMFASFGLSAAPVGRNTWRVRAATIGGRRDQLLMSRTLAGPTRRNPQFEAARTAVDELPPFDVTPEIQRRLDQRRAAAQNGDNQIDQLAVRQTELMIASAERCRPLVEENFEYLGKWIKPDGEEMWFPERSAHVVTATGSLYRRVRLPSIILGAQQNPTLINELRSGTPKMSSTASVFGTASEQINSLALAGAYLAPLLGSLLPHVWCYPCPRPLSMFVFGFGRLMPGVVTRTTGFGQLLPLYREQGSPTSPPSPISPDATESALDWWVLRIDQLFRYLTDPATFMNSRELYAAHEQLHWMLTFDQLLRVTASIQAGALHDRAARRIQSFTLLGSLADRILPARTTLKKLFTLNYARNQLDSVEKSMPAAARQILLPAARRAVDALREVQDGFFIPDPSRSRQIVLQMPHGLTETFDLEQATARLMVIHRNATHGYGGIQREDNQREREINERLLAHHNGRIPDDIALLAYLYLLAVLSQPEQVEKRIIETVSKI